MSSAPENPAGLWYAASPSTPPQPPHRGSGISIYRRGRPRFPPRRQGHPSGHGIESQPDAEAPTDLRPCGAMVRRPSRSKPMFRAFRHGSSPAAVDASRPRCIVARDTAATRLAGDGDVGQRRGRTDAERRQESMRPGREERSDGDEPTAVRSRPPPRPKPMLRALLDNSPPAAVFTASSHNEACAHRRCRQQKISDQHSHGHCRNEVFISRDRATSSAASRCSGLYYYSQYLECAASTRSDTVAHYIPMCYSSQ